MGKRATISGWAIAVGVLVNGCTGGADPAEPASPATTGAGGSTSTSTVGPAVDGDPAIAVVLAPDRLVVGGNALVYGAPRSQVRAYLDRALGAPTSIEEQDCGPGRLEALTWPGVVAYVDAGGFVGWAASDDTFSTSQGIGVGSSRSELDAAHPGATVSESTLGTEFFVPGPTDDAGLSGIYEGGEIAALWSGATCVAR